MNECFAGPFASVGSVLSSLTEESHVVTVACIQENG